MIDLVAIKANRNKFRSSTLPLIGANLLPLFGVLFWDWSILNVVAIYWIENLIVGAINILKMLTCSPDPEQLDLSKFANRFGRKLSGSQEEKLEKAEELLNRGAGALVKANHTSKLFFIPFFTVHYGIFCLVHGVFVFALLGGSEGGGFGHASRLRGVSEMVDAALAGGAVWAILALAASHLISYFVNFIGKGEFRETAVPFLMMAPYGRIVVLHLAILFGAFAIMLLKSPIFLLVLLIAGKILLDVGFHIRSHMKVGDQAGDAGESPPSAGDQK